VVPKRAKWGERVEEVGGSVKALSPELCYKGSLEQQGVHDIVGGTNHALDLTVLRGSVGTQHPKLDIMREEESAGGGVIKLMPIITLLRMVQPNCVDTKAKK
jgi:hypothetical protein